MWSMFNPTDTVSFVQAGNETIKVSPGTKDILRVSTIAQSLFTDYDMKTLEGIMRKGMVNVIRDTGCTGVIVKQLFVSPKALTCKIHTCMMIDRTTM